MDNTELAAGQPLNVTGTSNYPDLTVILYKVTTTSAPERSRATCNLHRGQSPASFSCTLDTKGQESGLYKVEVIPSGEKDGSKFSSGSIYDKKITLTGGSDQKSVVTSIATDIPTQAVITSVPTFVSTTSPPTPRPVTAIPTVETTLPSPSDIPSPVPTTQPTQPGLKTIVSLFISLAGFGLIEYSVIYWQSKKRK